MATRHRLLTVGVCLRHAARHFVIILYVHRVPICSRLCFENVPIIAIMTIVVIITACCCCSIYLSTGGLSLLPLDFFLISDDMESSRPGNQPSAYIYLPIVRHLLQRVHTLRRDPRELGHIRSLAIALQTFII